MERGLPPYFYGFPIRLILLLRGCCWLYYVPIRLYARCSGAIAAILHRPGSAPDAFSAACLVLSLLRAWTLSTCHQCLLPFWFWFLLPRLVGSAGGSRNGTASAWLILPATAFCRSRRFANAAYAPRIRLIRARLLERCCLRNACAPPVCTWISAPPFPACRRDRVLTTDSIIATPVFPIF